MFLMNGRLGQYGEEKRKGKPNEDEKKFGWAGSGAGQVPLLNQRGWAGELPMYGSLPVIKQMTCYLSNKGEVLVHGIGGLPAWAGEYSSRRLRSVRIPMALSISMATLTILYVVAFVPEEYALGTVFDYARHRIMNGVPEGSVDMAEAIPFERNVDIMGGGIFIPGNGTGSLFTAFLQWISARGAT